MGREGAADADSMAVQIEIYLAAHPAGRSGPPVWGVEGRCDASSDCILPAPRAQWTWPRRGQTGGIGVREARTVWKWFLVAWLLGVPSGAVAVPVAEGPGLDLADDPTIRSMAVAEDADLAYVGMAGGSAPEFRVIDFSDLMQPTVVGLTIGSSVNDILLDGDIAYLATDDSDQELKVVDLTDPAMPILLDSNYGFNTASNEAALTIDYYWVFLRLGTAEAAGSAPEAYVLDYGHPKLGTGTDPKAPELVSAWDAGGDVADMPPPAKMQNVPTGETSLLGVTSARRATRFWRPPIPITSFRSFPGSMSPFRSQT